jgi:hypothetical protein
MGVTDDRNDPALKNIGPDGMQEKYLVLSDEERAKGFVRPLRKSYKHVGPPPPKITRELTAEEHERYDEYGYVAFEPYETLGAVTGRFWTQEQLDRANGSCGAVTTMGLAIAETYARNPSFYGGTFCAHCGGHFPVGAQGEFVWDGTDERVGT